MTLIETAMAVQGKRRTGRQVTPEERGLAIAWAQGKVTITQVAVALNTKSGGVYPFLANALRQIYVEQMANSTVGG